MMSFSFLHRCEEIEENTTELTDNVLFCSSILMCPVIFHFLPAGVTMFYFPHLCSPSSLHVTPSLV